MATKELRIAIIGCNFMGKAHDQRITKFIADNVAPFNSDYPTAVLQLIKTQIGQFASSL